MAVSLPTVPAYYASPKLEYKIAQNIQVAFDSGLGWLDRSYHIARVGIDSSQKSSYPQIYKNDGSKEHFDIRPDSSIGAYSFFEIDRPFVANKYENTLSCFFNVIFWCNLELVDPAKTYDYTSELISEVLDVLASQGAIVTETETRPENIFNNYSALQQELKQHLMRSYSGFKITFEVNTTLNDTCVDVVIDSCEQNVARINALPTSVKDCVIAAISDCPTPDMDTFLNFIFGIGATADYTQTIASGEEGVYTANTLTNVSSVVYKKNGNTVTLPITLVVSDTLQVLPTITNTAIVASVKLTGTYT